MRPVLGKTGLPLGAAPGSIPRPEYDPLAHSLTERVQAKASELGTTLRTVQRMLRRYRNQNLWGLVDARSTRRAKPMGNVDPRVVAAAVTIIGKQENASTGTKSRVVHRIRPGSGSEVRVLVFDARQPAGQFC